MLWMWLLKAEICHSVKKATRCSPNWSSFFLIRTDNGTGWIWSFPLSHIQVFSSFLSSCCPSVVHLSLFSLPFEVSITVACRSHGCPPTLSCRLASGREVLWRWGTTCGLDLSYTQERRRGTTTCPSLLWRRHHLSLWRMWTPSAAPAWGTRYPAASSLNSGEDLNWLYFQGTATHATSATSDFFCVNDLYDNFFYKAALASLLNLHAVCLDWCKHIFRSTAFNNWSLYPSPFCTTCQ